MKHLGYFLDMANDPAITKKYSSFIRSQGSAVIMFATGAYHAIFSLEYYQPDDASQNLSLK